MFDDIKNNLLCELKRKSKRYEIKESVVIQNTYQTTSPYVLDHHSVSINNVSELGIEFSTNLVLDTSRVYKTDIILYGDNAIHPYIQIKWKQNKMNVNYYGAEFMGLTHHEVDIIDTYILLTKNKNK